MWFDIQFRVGHLRSCVPNRLRRRLAFSRRRLLRGDLRLNLKRRNICKGAAIMGTVSPNEGVVVLVSERRLPLQEAKRHREPDSLPGEMLHPYGKLRPLSAPPHAFDEVGGGVELVRERPRILRGRAADALHRGIGEDRGAQARRELIERLVSECEADMILARLRQDRLDGIVEILLCLVHIYEGRIALPFGECRALERRLRDHRDKEASEKLAAFALQQVLGGADEDNLAFVHRLEEIELVSLLGEHALEGGCRENAPKATQNLLLGRGK